MAAENHLVQGGQMAFKLTSEKQEWMLFDSMSLNWMYPHTVHEVTLPLLVFQTLHYRCNRQIEWKMEKKEETAQCVKWISKLPVCPFTGLKSAFLFFPYF